MMKKIPVRAVMRRARGISFSALLCAILSSSLFGACAFITAHHNATRHENFTRLYAYHVKFVEDLTAPSDTEWSEASVKQSCGQGDLRFREALVFAKSIDKKDRSGETAVQILKEEFEAACKLSLSRKALFSPAWTKAHLEEVGRNYGHAFVGEFARVKKTP